MLVACASENEGISICISHMICSLLLLQILLIAIKNNICGIERLIMYLVSLYKINFKCDFSIVEVHSTRLEAKLALKKMSHVNVISSLIQHWMLMFSIVFFIFCLLCAVHQASHRQYGPSPSLPTIFSAKPSLWQFRPWSIFLSQSCIHIC